MFQAKRIQVGASLRSSSAQVTRKTKSASFKGDSCITKPEIQELKKIDKLIQKNVTFPSLEFVIRR